MARISNVEFIESLRVSIILLRNELNRVEGDIEIYGEEWLVDYRERICKSIVTLENLSERLKRIEK